MVAAFLLTAGNAVAEWVDFEGCRLAPNEANDGDSFHVLHKDREYVFRLYFVDSPETSEMIPSRVVEQTKAFETTKDKLFKAGKEAAAFTKKQLRGSFKISTRWQDARGMSDLGRHYAFVETSDGKDLGELLVAAGLARSFGTEAATESRQAGQLRQRYDRLQQKAKREGLGIWGSGKSGSVGWEEADEEGSEDTSEDDEGAGGLMDSALGATSLSASGPVPSAKPRPSPSPRPALAKASPSPPRSAKAGTGKIKLDPNKATKDELMALPGIDEAKADAIIAARPFAGSYDLLRVPGVGPATLKEIYPYIEE